MERFIDPRTLAKVKDMPLIAKTVAEGFLHGMQTSMQRGVGIEFSQYRSYEEGDEINRIDWKLYARSDRYFVREAERESEIDVWFVLDASRSMMQKSVDENDTNWDKLEYAKHLIASVSYMAQKQGDTIGYLGISSEQLNFLPSGNGERQWHRLLRNLATTFPGNYFPKTDLLKQHIAQLQKPAIIFIISDFYQRQNEITDFVSKLNSTVCEVVALQLTCTDEVEFNYKGATRFKDLESGEEVLVSAIQARATYQKKFKQYQNNLKTLLKQLNAHSHQFNIDQPMDEILFEYMRQRHRLK
jgi:uncharacterized protein (DUF58 family)